jgi:hypothetical protein
MLARDFKANIMNRGGKKMEVSSIEVQIVLTNLIFPSNKTEILMQAQKHGASCEVIKILKNIPDRGYTRATEVTREFKGYYKTWG